MPAEVIDGHRIAAQMCAELEPRIAALKNAGITPGFAVVLVGDDAGEHAHVRRKMEVCEEVGVVGEPVILPASTSESQVLETIHRLNTDQRIHGILVQLPLPNHLCVPQVLQSVDPIKDADGYHPLNEGKVAAGVTGGRPRAAALAIQQMLIRSGVVIRGAHVVVVGQSNPIARPVATLLAREGTGGGAAVTLCPEWTMNLPAIARDAHVVIAAVGRAHFVSRDMIGAGAVVIDAGANRMTDDHGESTLAGDVRFEDVREVARAVSPVPGGVGPVTIAALLLNTVEAAESWLRN